MWAIRASIRAFRAEKKKEKKEEERGERRQLGLIEAVCGTTAKAKRQEGAAQGLSFGGATESGRVLLSVFSRTANFKQMQ